MGLLLYRAWLPGSMMRLPSCATCFVCYCLFVHGNVSAQVLSIGETVEEVNDSGFLGPTPTLRCQLLADDSILQVKYKYIPPLPHA